MKEDKIEKIAEIKRAIIMQEIKMQRPFGEMYNLACLSNINELKVMLIRVELE